MLINVIVNGSCFTAGCTMMCLPQPVLLNCQGLVTKRTKKLHSDEFKSIFSSKDIILLTEFSTDKFSDKNVSNFETFALHRQENKRNCKRNSGGGGRGGGHYSLYHGQIYVNSDTLVFTAEGKMLWVKIGKSVLSLNEDLYICLCYVTPDESSSQSLIETNIFDRLLDSAVYVKNKTQNKYSILICGDFNSRTSVNPDFVSDDISVHMSVLPDDYISDSFCSVFQKMRVIQTVTVYTC